MATVTLNIPDSAGLNEKELTTMLAANLYDAGKLSLGQAAEMAGYSKRAFMEILGNYNVSIFTLSESDLETDMQNAANYYRWQHNTYPATNKTLDCC